MLSEIVVPDPEPGWASALSPYLSPDGERNPATQYFTFEQALGDFRPIGCLKVQIADIARRLRLMLEPGFSQLGEVEAAFLSIRRIGFAIYHHGDDNFTLVNMHWKDETATLDAVDALLEALGVDWRAVATVNFGTERNPLYLEPVLDKDLRPTFPDLPDGLARSGSDV